MMKSYLVFALVYCCTLFSFLPFAVSQWGSPITLPGEARDGAAGFTLGGKGYVACGILSKDIYEYNPVTSEWAKKADAPEKNSFSTCFTAGGKAYLVGGDSAFGKSMVSVWEYDPVANSWTSKKPFPGGARVGMLTWTVQNRVFVGGGTNAFGGSGFGSIYDDLYEYNASADTWQKLSSMPIKAAFASCFVIDNMCYMTFGAQSAVAASSDLWQYNPTTSAWKKMKACPGTARSGGIGLSIKGKGYAGMGQTALTTNLRDFYEYNPADDSWTKLKEYPDTFSAWSTAFVLDDKAYIGTGINMELFDFSSSLYSFSPVTTSTDVPEYEGATAASVIPNPASDYIRLQMDTWANDASPLLVEISNTLGESLMRIHTLASVPLSVAHLPQGSYNLRLRNERGDELRTNFLILR